MALKTYRCLYKVQGCVFEPTSSISSRLPLLFRGLDKLASAQTPLSRSFNILKAPLGPLNILTTTFINPKALPRVYSNKEMQEIIQTIMEARSATVEGPCKRFFKARFPNIYGGDNLMAFYNFC